eukprot:1161664-Pelagomonas_calceolata.AAC.4
MSGGSTIIPSYGFPPQVRTMGASVSSMLMYSRKMGTNEGNTQKHELADNEEQWRQHAWLHGATTVSKPQQANVQEKTMHDLCRPNESTCAGSRSMQVSGWNSQHASIHPAVWSLEAWTSEQLHAR